MVASFEELCKNTTQARSPTDQAVLELFKTQPVVMSIGEENAEGTQKKPYIALKSDLVMTKAVRIQSPTLKSNLKAQVEYLMELVKGNSNVVVEDRLNELYHSLK